MTYDEEPQVAERKPKEEKSRDKKAKPAVSASLRKHSADPTAQRRTVPSNGSVILVPRRASDRFHLLQSLPCSTA